MFSLSEDVLAKSKTLDKLWRAAHCHESTANEDACLPDICQELGSWVASDDADPRKRMSLRTSALLVDGAAKVYKQEMERLLQDVDQLDKDMITRRRYKSRESDITNTDSSEYSYSISPPELMMRQSRSPSVMCSTPITKEINPRNSSIKNPQIDHSLSSCSELSRSPIDLAANKISSFQEPQDNNTCGNTKSDSNSRNSAEGDKSSQEQTAADKNSYNEEPRDKTILCDITKPDENSNNTSERDNTGGGSTRSIAIGSKRRTNTTDGSKSKSNIHGPSLTSESSEHGTAKRLKRTDNLNATESDGSGNTGSDLNKLLVASNITNEGSVESEAGGNSMSTQSLVFRRSTEWCRFGDISNVEKNQKDIGKTIEKRDQGSQTCFPLRDTVVIGAEEFDKGLPLGYLLIHETYGSRVPSRIVVCSLNPRVRDLMCS